MGLKTQADCLPGRLHCQGAAQLVWSSFQLVPDVAVREGVRVVEAKGERGDREGGR